MEKYLELIHYFGIVLILLYSGVITSLYTGIDTYGDLFHFSFITHSMDVFSHLVVMPVAIYSNAKFQKASILAGNKGKIGCLSLNS
jgi:hypothetical protein